MSRPPLWMNVRVKDESNGARFFIPLPLFLVLVLVLAFLIILSPLILLAAVVLWCMGWAIWLFREIGYLFNVICAMPGLEVNVQGPEQIVKVTIF